MRGRESTHEAKLTDLDGPDERQVRRKSGRGFMIRFLSESDLSWFASIARSVLPDDLIHCSDADRCLLYVWKQNERGRPVFNPLQLGATRNANQSGLVFSSGHCACLALNVLSSI